MKKYFWFIFILFLISFSCNERGSRIHKKETIPPEKLVPIITDIHLADAILGMPTYIKKFPGKDSLSNYQDIFDYHDYTMLEFETTLKYYSNKPVEFEEIYEEVLDNLSKLESEIKSQRYDERETDGPGNLWLERPEWNLPENGPQIKLPFTISINQMGFYIIRVRIKMYEDDRSLNPKVLAYFWYDDGTVEGKKIPFPESRIQKDEKWMYHTISLKTTDPKITHLKGFLLEHDSLDGDWAKHVKIENISIRFQK